MKTNDQRLENAVAHWHANAEPPTTLRARVLDTPTTMAIPLPHAPRVNHRVWWATGAAVAFSAATITIVATVSTPPRPAYADVERAMKQVKTVEWDTDVSTYEPPFKKLFHYETHQKARLNPPALYTEWGGDGREIETPEWIITRMTRNDKVSGTPFVAETRERRPLRIPDPVADLRARFNREILPPRRTPPGDPNPTTVTKVVEQGRVLLRFDSQLGRKWNNPDRLTRPGYRMTVWADPQTFRAVRTRDEYYDGTMHRIAISRNFRYDVPLPNALFDITPPPSP